MVRPRPCNVLSGFGWNAPRIVRSAIDVTSNLNEALREAIDEKIEIKVLRPGSIPVFDYDVEVEPLSSNSLFRTLYYALALKSAINYAKLHGLEGRSIALLEELETHILPLPNGGPGEVRGEGL